MMKILAITAVLLFGCLGVVQAGPVVPKHIAKDAVWFGHVNVDAIRKLELVQQCKDKWCDDESCAAKVKKITAKLGMNPVEDLRGVTVYANQYEGRNCTALVYVQNLDRKVLLASFEKEHPEHQTTEYGERTLYAWTAKHCGKEEKLCSAFGSDTLLVISTDLANLKAALDVVDDKREGLAKDAELLAGVKKRALCVSRAMNVPAEYRGTTTCPVLRNCTAGFVQWSEKNGTITGRYQLTTVSEDAADDFKAVIAGFKAMATLRFGGIEPVEKLIAGLKCRRKNSSMLLCWKATTDDIHAAIKAVMELKKPKKVEEKPAEEAEPAAKSQPNAEM